MASSSSALIPCGQFKTSYRKDTTIFPTPVSRGFAIAAIVLLCLAPLFLLTAIVIWVVDPGPVFYAQERIGRDGQMFRCLKFRTMVMDAERKLAAVLRENAVELTAGP